MATAIIECMQAPVRQFPRLFLCAVGDFWTNGAVQNYDIHVSDSLDGYVADGGSSLTDLLAVAHEIPHWEHKMRIKTVNFASLAFSCNELRILFPVFAQVSGCPIDRSSEIIRI